MRSSNRPWLLPLAVLWTALLCNGCGAVAEPETRQPSHATPSAQAWPDGDRLFHQDAHWLGGDAAVSINLGGGRILWLFGDSFISDGKREQAGRRGTRMVRNSVALQTGADPASAEMRFITGNDGGSFFPEQDGRWFWPQHGVVIDGALTIFLYALVHDDASPLGFRYDGWTALRIANPQQDPAQWETLPLVTKDVAPIEMVGTSVLADAKHVYAYGVREPGDHAIFVLRWTRRAFVAGDLADPRVYAGPSMGWTRGPPAAVVASGQTEFSVTPLPAGGYVLSQTVGFGSAALALRFAPAPEGPFSDPVEVYRPDESGRSSILVYGARAHPELDSEGLLLTYNVNTLDGDALFDDLGIYYPRFVRVTF